MMDRLFTLNRDDFRTTLDVVCRYLTSLRDILSLEEVTELCRSAVWSHKWNKEVILRWPEDRNHILKVTSAQDVQRGPIISNLNLQLYNPTSALDMCRGLEGILTTISERAAYLQRLRLDLIGPDRELATINEEVADRLLRLTDSSLTDPFITFTRCTVLRLEFGFLSLQIKYTYLLPRLLRHFPSLEHLRLEGTHLPRLCELPAPEKLKKLIIQNASTDGFQSDRSESIAVNFAHLESLTLGVSGDESSQVEDGRQRDCNACTRITGFRFLESFNSPALMPRLRKLNLFQLTKWSVALLSSAAVVQYCRSLEIYELELDLIQDLAQRLPGGVFPHLTHLTIVCGDSEQLLSEFLKLTPSLVDFHVIGEFNETVQQDVDCPLRSLTRLRMQDDVRPGWVESVRRNASPAGLEVKLHNFDEIKDSIDDEEEY